MKLYFAEGNGYFPVIQYGPEAYEQLEVPVPVAVELFSGGRLAKGYDLVFQKGDTHWIASAAVESQSYGFKVEDNWRVEGGRVTLERSFIAAKTGGGDSQAVEGCQLSMGMRQPGAAGEPWRFCSPATMYTETRPLGSHSGAAIFMDDRLTYPFILGYRQDTKRSLTLGRTSLPEKTEPRRRKAKENRFLQRTEVGSVGYAVNVHKGELNGAAAPQLEFRLHWPYYEGDRSVALNADRKPVSAFYPLEEDVTDIQLSYELLVGTEASFSDAVFAGFKHFAGIRTPEPVQLTFSLRDSMEYRRESLKKSYKELENGGAGFFFHFDPRHGYFSEPSGFGTAFNNIPHDSYNSLLEYGFTGRQLNAAYVLGEIYGNEWLDKGKKVIDFFVDRCTVNSGWLYSLFDLIKDEPFYSFGDPDALKLHYINQGTVRGNYLRLMVEPALDLLMNFRLYREQGRHEPRWLEVCRAFGDFLVRHQNADGSWYRSYEPDGTPLKNAEGFGIDDFSAKSASSIPVQYLLALADELPERKDDYLRAALKAGDFIIETYVSSDYYLGGTLDNPNVVDKEAVQYAMAALLSLYLLTGDKKHLEGAARAAKIFVTWNYIWNAPTMQGTDLDRVKFQTVGTGGINSIWGGGVVDIYSLFHIEELDRLGKLAEEPFFNEMAHWIAVGTQQLLSHPKDLMGFTDIGMQPEGFGICDQGVDAGMIAKGDIWGTLGWIYSAGIYGLGKYLAQADATE